MKIKAFTLIELLVVVAIIGILAAVGVVAYNGYTASAKASVVKQTDGYHLVVTSNKTGADNEISLSFTADADSDELNTFFTTNTEAQVAQDAAYNIDGIDMVSSSNVCGSFVLLSLITDEKAPMSRGQLLGNPVNPPSSIM